MDAAQAVRVARRRAGLSQRALAAHAGVSARTVAAIEAGQGSPTWRTVSALLAAAELEPALDRALPTPCAHLVRYLRYSTSERLYLSLGGTYQPARDLRLAPWREVTVSVRSPGAVTAEELGSLRIATRSTEATGWVPVAVPYGGVVLVPPPELLALDAACASQRVATRAAARLLHEQSGRDEAARRAAVHRDPDEPRERTRLQETRAHGNGALELPSRMTSRAWRLEGRVSLRQWMWDHQYPGVE